MPGGRSSLVLKFECYERLASRKLYVCSWLNTTRHVSALRGGPSRFWASHCGSRLVRAGSAQQTKAVTYGRCGAQRITELAQSWCCTAVKHDSKPRSRRGMSEKLDMEWMGGAKELGRQLRCSYVGCRWRVRSSHIDCGSF